MSPQSFDTISWEQKTYNSTTLLHKHQVPYRSNANTLQNLEIYIPTHSSSLPSPSSFPSSQGLWIIYIHGGAWRDPDVESSSFTPTITHLLNSEHSSTLPKIGGIASINYSLTARTHDPTSPEFTNDPSRQAKHPDHILDILTALEFLQQKAGFGGNYILLGHSCGATLAFQTVMNHNKWSAAASAFKVKKPIAVIGLNGLYDMPSLIKMPGEKHEHLKEIYEVFTRLAFGDDEKVWEEISPSSVRDWKGEWPEGKKVVLVQSKEDSLVPYAQIEEMKRRLEESGGDGLDVGEMEAGGDHNDLWKDGARLADIIVQVVERLT
jgi:acetyl esterase/lipase